MMMVMMVMLVTGRRKQQTGTPQIMNIHAIEPMPARKKPYPNPPPRKPLVYTPPYIARTNDAVEQMAGKPQRCEEEVAEIAEDAEGGSVEGEEGCGGEE